MAISESIIEYFASENMEVSWLMHDIIKDLNHPIHNQLQLLISSFSNLELEELLTDPKISFLCKSSNIQKQYELARDELASRIIDDAIVKKRMSVLLGKWDNENPLPYNHPDMEGIVLDKNFLVNVSVLRFNRTRLERGQSVFHILPSLPQRNSMYWVIPNLVRLSQSNEVHVRLDPFMVQPIATYKESFYKMLVYGIPLNWDDISNLTEDRHARWLPDSLTTSGVKFTDVVWSPRSDGIHFICEELPNSNALKYRGSRYLHAIYNPTTKKITHFDGAIRIYNEIDLNSREKVHVRNGGKAGTRIKLFQVNGEVDRDIWCNIAASFFVWNTDVQNYFRNAQV